jgi:hypothetical protein
MSPAGEEVVAWGGNLRTGAVVQHRGLAGASFAGYLALLAVFGSAPPRVIEAPTVLEIRETYAAYIDMPPSDAAVPQWVAEPVPRFTWQPWRLPPENEQLKELLRILDEYERLPSATRRPEQGRRSELHHVQRENGRARVLGPRAGEVSIVGNLSSKLIRRTIQRHVNQARFCYEQGLHGKPDLQGRVAVRFIIGPMGDVLAAVVAASDLGDRRVEACIASAVGRWKFPSSEGSGIVSVTYPFVLQQVGQ